MNMHKRQFIQFKVKAVQLRRNGKTYADIQKMLGVKIPKSTLSTWLHPLVLSEGEIKLLDKRRITKINSGHAKAMEIAHKKREARFAEIHTNLKPLVMSFKNGGVGKIALAMLYWCEGSKKTRSFCSFGNSDPRMIRFFLKLIRESYTIDESKFRCTVQCRADQNVELLNDYWSKITDIPLRQFYAARKDSRTIGKPTKKLDYKGVCKIDYFSARVYNELRIIASLLSEDLGL